MTTWNYRVFRLGAVGEPAWLEIREVYYNDAGEPRSYTERAVPVSGEDLALVIEKMAAALREPILTEGDFPDGGEGDGEGEQGGG